MLGHFGLLGVLSSLSLLSLLGQSSFRRGSSLANQAGSLRIAHKWLERSSAEEQEEEAGVGRG